MSRAAPRGPRLTLLVEADMPVRPGVRATLPGGSLDPAAAVLHQGVARGLTYDAVVVRKAPKDHGRGRQVEGPDVDGKRVVVLEDTSPPGGSPLTAARALEAAGATVVAVAVVVDRATDARRVIEEAGYEYRAAIGLADLGLDAATISAHATALVTRAVAGARESGELEAMVRDRLAPFWASPEVAALLEDRPQK